MTPISSKKALAGLKKLRTLNLMHTTFAFRSALILALTGYVTQPIALLAQQYDPAPAPGQYSYPTNPGYSGTQQLPQYPQGTPQYQSGYAPAPQASYYQTQQPSRYVSPLQFLHTLGRRVGNMFRRVFYGETAPAQPYYGNQGRLDQPPQVGYYQQPQVGYSQQPQVQYQAAPEVSHQVPVPRYETAPARTNSPAMPPTSRMNSGSSKAAPTMKKNPITSPPSVKKKTVQDSPPSHYRPSTMSRDASAPPAPPPTKPSHTMASRSTMSQPSPESKVSDTEAGTSSSKTEASSPKVNSGSFLRGKKAAKPGHVISPYPPYRELDVSGLASGSLALDPTTQKVFEVP
jgi:hypothetical protein